MIVKEPLDLLKAGNNALLAGGSCMGRMPISLGLVEFPDCE